MTPAALNAHELRTLPTAAWVELDRSSWSEDPGLVSGRCLALGLPLFVKPARLGSSVGISKVTDSSGLEPAIDLALAQGERVLVEKGLDVREIEIAVLGNQHPRSAVPGEVVPGHDFYDYDDKYIDSACQLLAPAPLDEMQTAAARELGVTVFELLGCTGMARVDLFLERDGSRFWVNEINTIPGFTPISMYPRLWELSGLSYPELIDELIRLGFASAR